MHVPLNVNISADCFNKRKYLFALTWCVSSGRCRLQAMLLSTTSVRNHFYFSFGCSSDKYTPASSQHTHHADGIGLQCRPRKRQNDDGRSGIEWHNADVCMQQVFFSFIISACCCRRPVIWQRTLCLPPISLLIWFSILLFALRFNVFRIE